MTNEEEDLVKAIKVLAGTTTIPLKVAAEIAGEIAESLETYIPQPSKLVSTLIDMRISTLKTINKVVEKEIDMLEKYKGELEGEGERKEKVKVE